MTHSSMNVRRDLVRRAFRLECLSAGWTMIEAVIAVVSGLPRTAFP